MRTRARACMQPPRCTSTRARAGTPTHAPKGARARTRAGTPMRAHVCARSRARRRAPTRVRALTLVQAGGGGSRRVAVGWPFPSPPCGDAHCPPLPPPLHAMPGPRLPCATVPRGGGTPTLVGCTAGTRCHGTGGHRTLVGCTRSGEPGPTGASPRRDGHGEDRQGNPPPQSPSRCRVGEQAGGTVRVSSYSRRCRRGCGAGAPDSGSGRRSSGWTGRHPAPPCS